MTTEATAWLDRLGQDIARADANSLSGIRAKLAEVAGDDPGTAIASLVEQFSVVRGHITAVVRQVFAARMESAGPACSSALAGVYQACEGASRLQATLVELAQEQEQDESSGAEEAAPGTTRITRSAWLAVGASLAGSSLEAAPSDRMAARQA